MNRTGILAAALLGVLLHAVPAGAQVALLVGSVRDQHGAPVESASIVALDPFGARVASTTTDAAGTFAVPADGAATVAIACRYCLSLRLAASPARPVVAIVRRFDALFDDSPSPGDLANLPYAHVESSIALHPFTLLRQTTSVIPGSQLSDRGLDPSNALVIDAGVPNYDVVLGTTPYDTIPAAYEQSGSIANPSNAFLYGDRAASGIVSLDPFGDANTGVALTGSDQTLRLEAGSNFARMVAGTYSNDAESRQRTDGSLTFPLSTAQTVLVSGGTSQDHDYGNPESTLNSNFSFANATFDDAQPTADVHAAFVADRGGYAATGGGLAITDVWSDADVVAGVRTRGPVALFADVSDRLSTGIYDASAYRAPRIGGTLTQDRLDAGIDASGNGYDVTAGIGFFNVGYTGGSGGYSTSSNGQLAVPSLDVRLLPNAKWSADFSASGSFTLPTLWQQYGLDDDYGSLVYDRNSLYTAILSYTDASRVSVSVEGASQHVVGYTNGMVTSSGVSVAWQIAPAISLRAWTMHVGDTTAPLYDSQVYPSGSPANVNAMWLTYANGSAVRADVIYRRDVLNGEPFEHVDAAISGPIANGLRWYAGVEDRARTEYLDVGVRFNP